MSRSQTPSAEHSALSLVLGTDEQVTALLKASPIKLANETWAEKPENGRILSSLRNNQKYVYVVSWLYQCRGYIKLAEEFFDRDLFEIELLNLVHPVPVDESVLFVNKLKTALILRIQGKKVSLAMFEPIFRMYFGSSTPLQGPTEEEEEKNEVDHSIYPKFDYLLIHDKIEVLYLLIREVSSYNDFRDFVDKYKLSPEVLRMEVIYTEHSDTHTEDYVLCYDDTALYKRITIFNELEIPKKRKLAPVYPDEHYEPKSFDVGLVSFQLVFHDIYTFNEFFVATKKSKTKKNRAILAGLPTDPDGLENFYGYELRKRKVLANRRREFEMTRLLATRKRSSRLEAKEKQRTEEEEKFRRESDEMRLAQQNRARRRSLRLNLAAVRPDYSAGVTREERLKMRKVREGSQIVEVKEEQAQPTEQVDAEQTDVAETKQTAQVSEPMEQSKRGEASIHGEEPVETKIKEETPQAPQVPLAPVPPSAQTPPVQMSPVQTSPVLTPPVQAPTHAAPGQLAGFAPVAAAPPVAHVGVPQQNVPTQLPPSVVPGHPVYQQPLPQYGQFSPPQYGSGPPQMPPQPYVQYPNQPYLAGGAYPVSQPQVAYNAYGQAYNGQNPQNGQSSPPTHPYTAPGNGYNPPGNGHVNGNGPSYR